jgi:hypothetical protein
MGHVTLLVTATAKRRRVKQTALVFRALQPTTSTTLSMQHAQQCMSYVSDAYHAGMYDGRVSVTAESTSTGLLSNANCKHKSVVAMVRRILQI